MYKDIIRPLLFLIDPERVHDLLRKGLHLYAQFPFIRDWIRQRYVTKSKGIVLNGIHFPNRIGLSAGFDKWGDIYDELADFGFGFLEIGTVTVHAQSGNPKPRIFRLTKDESLISRTGFNNPGLKEILAQVRLRRRQYILGVNINKDPLSEGKDAIGDFLYLFESLYSDVDYFTINWGSVSPELFESVLQTLVDYRKSLPISKPLYIKLPADIQPNAIQKVIELAERYSTEGFIAAGPTMKRNNLTHYTEEELQKIGMGGVSGKGMGNLSWDIVRFIRTHQTRVFTVIGAGGVMSAEDAETMIRAGADLVQIYSAFIYSGPEIVKEIKQQID